MVNRSPGTSPPDDDVAPVLRLRSWLGSNGGGHLIVSAAMPQTTVEELVGDGPVVVAPTVRGRTVWAAARRTAPGCAVVETPNHFGCVETVPDPALVIDRRMNAGGAIPDWDRGVATAVLLQKRLIQLAGVAAPFGLPEAPWFVMTTPVDADAVIDEVGRVVATRVDHAWLPGGVRFEVPRNARTEWVDGCVASVHRAITERST